MSDIQRRVQEAIDGLVASGAERGVQVAVYRHGEQVVDAVAGVADPATGRPVTAGHAVLLLLDRQGRGRDRGPSARRARPLRLRHADSRAVAGIRCARQGDARPSATPSRTRPVCPALSAGVTPEDLCDWEKMCAQIAAAEPWWEPGTKTAYHAYTFGYILGEIVRRATGKPISQVLREEVAAPLGIADEIYFGVPAAELGRLARLEDAARQRGISRLAARRFAVLQVGAARGGRERRTRQPRRHPHGRHPRRRQDVRARDGADVRRAAGRGGWRAARSRRNGCAKSPP